MTQYIQSRHKSQRGKRCSQWRKLGMGALGVMMFSLAGGAGFFYLRGTNDIAIQGYRMKALETRLEQLREENRALQNDIAELESLEYIRERVSELSLVPAEKVEYLSTTASVVARR